MPPWRWHFFNYLILHVVTKKFVYFLGYKPIEASESQNFLAKVLKFHSILRILKRNLHER